MARQLVMAFGVFDVLHPGHLAFLTAARALGTTLMVVVTRDAAVKKTKGRRSVMNEHERLVMVQALKTVDRAVLGDRGVPLVIKKYRPAIIAVGYDQDEQHPLLLKQLAQMKKHPRVIKLLALTPRRYHSKLIKHAHARP